MSRRGEIQRLIRRYKDETGEREVDMHRVVKWAVGKGWPLPVPVNPLDLLAREFSTAAREEIKHDKETGDPYRVYHSITVKHGETQLHLFIDIDEAPRSQMLKSLISRREQMVGDGLQLTFDMEHWNRVNPKEEPIDVPMDLSPDIQWRKHAPKEDGPAA